MAKVQIRAGVHCDVPPDTLPVKTLLQEWTDLRCSPLETAMAA
jgi:hypothetical protein